VRDGLRSLLSSSQREGQLYGLQDGTTPRCGKYLVVCRIRNCEEIAAEPVRLLLRVRQVPLRSTSAIGQTLSHEVRDEHAQNLDAVRELGLDGFVASEKERWRCPRVAE